MASWAVHFRIADRIIDKLEVDTQYFIIGNIAPDCGVPCAGGYDPPSEVTHRTNNGNYKGNCDYKSIYNDFIVPADDFKSKSFWIGYYVHLFTDCLWVKDLCHSIVDNFESMKAADAAAKQIRREWYNLDFEYFNNNKSKSFELFKEYSVFDEDYPDFYKNNDIARQMKNIVKFYSDNNPSAMRYIYTTPEMVDDFIINAELKICRNLSDLNI